MTGQLLLCSHPRLESTLRQVPTARAAADDRRDEVETEGEKERQRNGEEGGEKKKEGTDACGAAVCGCSSVSRWSWVVARTLGGDGCVYIREEGDGGFVRLAGDRVRRAIR